MKYQYFQIFRTLYRFAKACNLNFLLLVKILKMAYNSALSKVQVLNTVLMLITLICVIVTSWKSIRKCRETQDRNFLYRRNVFDYTTLAVLDDLTTRIRYYYVTFLFLSLITIPIMIIMSYYRNWKAFLVASAVFTLIWLVKLVIFLSSNEEYYNWLSTFCPIGEYLSQFFNALACANSFVLVSFLRKRELESE